MKRGRPKRRWLHGVRGGIKEKGLSEEEVYDRATWRRVSSNIDPHESGNKMKKTMMMMMMMMMTRISTHRVLERLSDVDVHIEDCLGVLHDVTETTLARLRRLVKSRLKTQYVAKLN